MGNYSKGESCSVLDALFRRFIIKDLKFFKKQPKLSVVCEMAKKKKEDTNQVSVGEEFFKELI